MTPRRILLLTALLFSCATLAHGQSFVTIDPPAPNASLLVCPVPSGGNPCPSPVTIYSDSGLSSSITQPIQLGSSGMFGFWVPSGQYTIQLSGAVNKSYVVSVGGGGGGSVNVNGSLVNSPNFNASTPSPDAGNLVCTFKTNNSNVILQCPFGTAAGTFLQGNANAISATALAANPTLCSAGQAPTGILASGNATGCAAVLTNPMTTPADLIVGGAAGAPARLAGPTSPNSVPFFPSSTPSGGVAGTITWTPSGITARGITGSATTDTILVTDAAGGVVAHIHSATGAVTETIPTQASLGLTAPIFKYCNNSPQTDTLSPTTNTIQAGNAASAATLSVGPGVCYLIHLDPSLSTNWLAESSGAAGSGLSSTLTSGNIFVGNGSNVATGVAVSGDLSNTNAGVFSVTGVHFNTTAIAFSVTAPTSGQAIGYNGTNLLGQAINLAGGSTIVSGTLPNANLVNSGATTVNSVSCTLGTTTCDVGSLFDTNGVGGVNLVTVASAVNALQVTEGAAGSAVSIAPGGTGSDTNIGLTLAPKGAAALTLNGPSSSSLLINSSGAVSANPSSGSNFATTLLGGGHVLVTASSTASDIPFQTKAGTAAPTADQIQELSSTSTVLAALGPSGILHDGGTQIISAADYTNSTVTPSTVFSWTLPPTAAAKTYRYSCDITWESTNTTLVGPVFGLNISAAPTQLTGTGYVKSALNSITNAEAEGYLSNATTGSQTLVTGNAAGITSTNYYAKIWGTIEGAPTAGSTFIINAASTSGTTATLNIRRGSSCVMTSTN